MSRRMSTLLGALAAVAILLTTLGPRLTAQAPAAAPPPAAAYADLSSETRFQLDLHVPDAALSTFLPKGWTPNVSAQGPAKDANLRAIWVDRITINGPDGRPVGKGSNRFAYLAAPVKDASGAVVHTSDHAP